MERKKEKPLGKKALPREVIGLPTKKVVCSLASLAVSHLPFLSNDTRTQIFGAGREAHGEETIRPSSEW